jgi:hypothetical protein
MIRTPAHKQTDPAKLPGQIVGQGYKPAHGGYPGEVCGHPYGDYVRRRYEMFNGLTQQETEQTKSVSGL